jgi:hypothetical protein
LSSEKAGKTSKSLNTTHQNSAQTKTRNTTQNQVTGKRIVERGTENERERETTTTALKPREAKRSTVYAKTKITVAKQDGERNAKTTRNSYRKQKRRIGRG